MDIGMYQGAAALNAYEQWHNNTAHNLANISTSGFKGQSIALHKDPIGKIPMRTDSAFERMLLGSSPEATDKTNFKEGSMIQTGKDTDFAIEGKGFFQVQLEEGDTMYTRNGEFHINAERNLVTNQGHQVLGPGGEPINIPIGDEEAKELIRVNRFGEIFVGDTQAGIIGVVEVENVEALQHREGGFVVQGETNINPSEEGTFSVYQGFIEGSNTSAMRELGNMMLSTRAYESNMKVIQTFDTRYGQAISGLSTS